jgi:phosphomannomutase
VDRVNIKLEPSLLSWQNLVTRNRKIHAVDYHKVIEQMATTPNLVVGVDCMHGAGRKYIAELLGKPPAEKLFTIRDTDDPSFGGIAPEPSSANMKLVVTELQERKEKLKIGAIIDPDGDRIRFTDGETEISMNQFGAMTYHFLHEIKGGKGMVAKTVATSNLANNLAKAFGEEVFEPKVGFKEFKPVIDKALVFFEESDGISIIGHTPEKDGFIGLILAIDMVTTLKKNLGDYLREIEDTYGSFFPDRDGIAVSKKGEELQNALSILEKYGVASKVFVGNKEKTIKEVLTIDGRKMIFEDDSWIMIRASGTEPKVRFYVEARKSSETPLLVQAAKSMLAETGVID